MPDTTVPIGHVKWEIADLVNRVAYRGERIILTTQDKPQAALVSMDDYERLREEETTWGTQATKQLVHWKNWLIQADALADGVARRRGGSPFQLTR